MIGRDRTWRFDRLAAARLYVCVGLADDLERLLDGLLAAGVDVVQLRDKDASRSELAEAAASFRATALRHGALFIVNDDPQLAAEVEADGVHVGQDDPDPDVARAAVGAEALVGLSTHDVEQIDAASFEDVDYIGVGPVYETPTKPGRPGIGLRPVTHAAEMWDGPFFVTGGMNSETAPAALDAGAHGLVVVRAILSASDPTRAAARIAGLLGT